jgi:hypothetical protein
MAEKKSDTKYADRERLPAGVVKVNKEGGMTIALERLRRNAVHTQIDVTADGIGCFNNPNGPTC